MRTSKDIDFTKVAFITYAVDEYLKDIPLFSVVSNYVQLYQDNEHTYHGNFVVNEVEHSVYVNTKNNKCVIDGEEYNAEQFVILFEGEGKETKIIKRITGIDLDDYISDVTYEDGTIEYLDIKGKKQLSGKWIKTKNNK